jgi:hypothetical protein
MTLAKSKHPKRAGYDAFLGNAHEEHPVFALLPILKRKMGALIRHLLVRGLGEGAAVGPAAASGAARRSIAQ